jgi:hypothetical protein
MEANSGSDEAFIMAKNLSNEAFYAGKEIESRKCLTLHSLIASSLLLPSFDYRYVLKFNNM